MTGLLTCRWGRFVERVLRRYSMDTDVDSEHVKVARYLLASKDNKFSAFLKNLRMKKLNVEKDVELLARMMVASLGADEYEVEHKDQELIIKSPRTRELSVQVSPAFDTEETKLVDVLKFFFSSGDVRTQERMQMSKYIRTKNFLLHAFLGKYFKDDNIVMSLYKVEIGLLYDYAYKWWSIGDLKNLSSG
jgi:hypothetical protein